MMMFYFSLKLHVLQSRRGEGAALPCSPGSLRPRGGDGQVPVPVKLRFAGYTASSSLCSLDRAGLWPLSSTWGDTHPVRGGTTGAQPDTSGQDVPPFHRGGEGWRDRPPGCRVREYRDTPLPQSVVSTPLRNHLPTLVCQGSIQAQAIPPGLSASLVPGPAPVGEVMMVSRC